MNIKFVFPNRKYFKMNRVILYLIFLFLVIESCTKCPSNQDLLDKAMPINLTSTDKNSLAFYL